MCRRTKVEARVVDCAEKNAVQQAPGTRASLTDFCQGKVLLGSLRPQGAVLSRKIANLVSVNGSYD